MKEFTNGQGRIVLSELSERQKTVLLDCISRMQAVQAQHEALKKEYQRLVAMAMPDGATGLDLEKGVFYYEQPKPPIPQLVSEDESPANEAAEDEASD